jgi:uncharacterized Zn finger protein
MGWRGYWEYYEKKEPKAVKDGIKAKSRRGSIGETWWSKRWIGVLESFDMGKRLTRGKSYARKGQVISIDVEKGIVRAKVQGTRKKPYQVKISLDPITDPAWEKVEDRMASKAIFAARLLASEMPHNIEDAFSEAGVSLFPASKQELETDCSCPDWANPCKHIAAVYYLLAERFDEDPFLIFKLRGRRKDEIIDALRERRASAVEEVPEDKIMPLEESLDHFWDLGDLDRFEVNPALPEVEHPILKVLGDSPFMVGRSNLTSLLEKAYEVVSTAAMKRALGETNGRESKEKEEEA